MLKNKLFLILIWLVSNSVRCTDENAIGAHIPVYHMHLIWAKNELKKNPPALHDACKAGDIPMIKLLIGAGADVNAKNNNCQAPLHIAAENDNSEVGLVLIDAGADINLQIPESPLHRAAKGGYVDITRMLINAGVDVNSKTALKNFDWTALHWAACKNHAKIVQLLVDNGAKIDIKIRSTGWTPIHWAAKQGNIEIAKILLSKFQFPQQEKLTTSFINSSDNQEVWHLKILALIDLIQNIEQHPDPLAAISLIKQVIIEQQKNILPFIDLTNQKTRNLLCSDHEILKVLKQYCMLKQFASIHELLALKTNKDETALLLARSNIQGKSCYQFLEEILNAKNFDELPEDLKKIILVNIEKLLHPLNLL